MIPGGTIEAVHIFGNASFFRATGKVTRIRIRDSQSDDIVQFMNFRMNRELIEVVPPHTVTSKFFLLLVAVGGCLAVFGAASLVSDNTITDFSLVVVGLSILLDSSVVFGLQNHQLLRPIPPFVAYAGLAIFTSGVVIWTPAIVLMLEPQPQQLGLSIVLVRWDSLCRSTR